MMNRGNLIFIIVVLASFSASAENLDCTLFRQSISNNVPRVELNENFTIVVDGEPYSLNDGNSLHAYRVSAKKIENTIEIGFDDYYLSTNGTMKWFSVMQKEQKSIKFGKKINENKLILTCNRV